MTRNRQRTTTSPLLKWMLILLVACLSLAVSTWLSNVLGLWSMGKGEASFLFVLGLPVLVLMFLGDRILELGERGTAPRDRPPE